MKIVKRKGVYYIDPCRMYAWFQTHPMCLCVCLFVCFGIGSSFRKPIKEGRSNYKVINSESHLPERHKVGKQVSLAILGRKKYNCKKS